MELIAAAPKRWARIAGAFYVASIVLGVFGAMASAPMLAPFAVAANLLGSVCYIAVTVILYFLFRPVSGPISLVAACISVAGCVLGALDAFHIDPLPFNFIVLFGVYCVLLGYLILRSNFFSRPIGALLILAGLNYFTFFSHALTHRLWPYDLIPGLIAEGALTIWLLVIGVDESRWRVEFSGSS